MKKKIKENDFPVEIEYGKDKNTCYVLKLYVTGTTPQSVRALENIKEICETHLKGRYVLEVIDLYKRPSLASGEQIIAAPTLIKNLPLPLRRIIGDMSNIEKVLVGLDLRPKPIEEPKPKDQGENK
jgi:circadian clock protein KaiB